MTQHPAPLFTRDDLNNILVAHAKTNGFTRFVLERFAAYTRYTDVTDTRNHKVDRVEDPLARTTAGYGQWRVPTDWIHRLNNNYANDESPVIEVEHYVAEDRGPGGVDHTVLVPLAFIFGDMETDAEYEQFLTLKARFEPTTDTEAATTEPVAGGDDVVTRGAAQRLLDVLPTDRRVPLTLVLADRQVAAEVYTAALTIVSNQTGGGMVHTIADVHAHAAELGLPQQELPIRVTRKATPTEADQQERQRARLNAARVLWVQSRSADAARAWNGSHLAEPKNRELAAEAYREALDRLLKPSAQGLKDVRRQVHAAAIVLGLDDNDLTPPKVTPQPDTQTDTQTDTQSDSPYDDPRAGQQPKADKPDKASQPDDTEQVTADLGYTLLNDLTGRLLGKAAQETHDPDIARRHYEKARAVLTLSGDDLFGKHTEQVTKALDDVASLIGLTKKK